MYIAENIHPQTVSVVRTRALDLGLQVIVGPANEINLSCREFSGILLQYPDTYGNVNDYAEIAKVARKNGVKI